MSTCQDNRIRVWDHVEDVTGEATVELVHSHDFNRYLTPFRAVWDGKDPREDTLVVGRFVGLRSL